MIKMLGEKERMLGGEDKVGVFGVKMVSYGW